jgi:hypothetical protein
MAKEREKKGESQVEKGGRMRDLGCATSGKPNQPLNQTRAYVTRERTIAHETDRSAAMLSHSRNPRSAAVDYRAMIGHKMTGSFLKKATTALILVSCPLPQRKHTCAIVASPVDIAFPSSFLAAHKRKTMTATANLLFLGLALLAICATAAVAHPHSGGRPCRPRPPPAHGNADAPYDVSCPRNYYTRAGLARNEPLKGNNLGWFNCTGSASTHDAITGQQTASFPLPPFNLQTLYDAECGCWITTNSLTPYEAREYGTGMPGHSLQGSCFEYEFAPTDGSDQPLKTVGRASNVGLLHRDVAYLHAKTGALAGQQTVVLNAHGDEMVLLRLYDPITSVPTFVQNVVCVKFASQP